jgi:hypothetical protein
MGKSSLILGLFAVLAAIAPGLGMYLGMGLGGMAFATGLVAYRRRLGSGWTRLAGAAGMTVAVVALVLAGGRYGLTWWAVDRLQDMLAAGQHVRPRLTLVG